MSLSAKKITKILRVLTGPSSIATIARHLFGVQYKTATNAKHLDEAIQWLCRAHDASNATGVSGGYHPPDGGWVEPYPETTGYIIPTLLQYGQDTDDSSLLERAVQMGDWEIDIQMPDGAVRGGIGVNAHPVVFNTGQVMLGWHALYRFKQDQRYLDASIRAGEWCIESMDEDGGWRRNTFHGHAVSYHSRVAWPMLELGEITSDQRFTEAGRRNILWVLSNAQENGWLDAMAFKPHEKVLTHTLAYTYRGLLESSRFLPDDREHILDVVRRGMENLLVSYERRKPSPNAAPKPLPATVDKDWRFNSKYSCPTGNVQLAIIWLKLYQLEGDARFLSGAMHLIDQVKSIQSLSSGNLNKRGAILGSFPSWGDYNPFSYPNWAAKFFADAVILQEKIMAKVEGQQ